MTATDSSLMERLFASAVRNLIADLSFLIPLAVALIAVAIADIRKGERLRTKYGSASARTDMGYAFLELTHIQALLILSPAAAALNGVIDAQVPWLRLSLLAESPWWIKVPVAFVFADFLAYWWHRAKHGNAWLWQLHKVHHSQSELTVFTRFRFPVLDRLSDLVVLVPLALITGSAAVPLAFLVLVALRSCLDHSGHDWTYGALGRVIVSPAFHGLHHSAAEAHHDKNFGAFLTVWDRMFGTMGVRGDGPIRHGLPGERDYNSLAYGPLAPLRGFWALAKARRSAPGDA